MLHPKKKVIRFFQKHITQLQEQIVFKTSHITYGGKITLIGVFISLISLFLPWIYANSSIISSGTAIIKSGSSFSGLLGYTGFFIFLYLVFLTFSIFSIRKKEKFHFFSLIHIYDHAVGFYGSLFMFILCLQGFFYAKGLQVFSSEILYGKGIILCITGAIVILIGSLILKKEYRKNIKGSYISELRSSQERQNTEAQKDNMKLPF